MIKPDALTTAHNELKNKHKHPYFWVINFTKLKGLLLTLLLLLNKYNEFKKDRGLIEGLRQEYEVLIHDTLKQYALIALYNQS